MKHFYLLSILISLSFTSVFAQQPKDITVQLSTVVQKSPKKITFSWATISGATSIKIYRKAKSANSWTLIKTLGGTATTYSDTSIVVGTDYEYRIAKSGGATAESYVYSGIEVPAIEYRGKLILLIDSTFKTSLKSDIKTMQEDLIGDGWRVLTYYVSRTTPVPVVKRIITTEYNADPTNVKAVYIFGHVPVPYSGEMNPDGHSNHIGAWPADTYYADSDSIGWNDFNVSNTSASRAENRNIPGDGKFDESDLPVPNYETELGVGRVDLYNMPQFSSSETQLLQNYLSKNHKYKHKQIVATRRGIIDDNFGTYGELFASCGWRDFSSLFGAANISTTDYFTTTASQTYLFAYGCGAGSYNTCAGIGSTGTFDSTSSKSVFTMFFGSYFGDWDSQNNFLRAPLASTGWQLTSAWVGRPYWYFHHMGLGENIGYSAMRSQSNLNTYYGNPYGITGVHMGLMGDPTLRLHTVTPPNTLKASINGVKIDLQWSKSNDSILGYYVYRLDTVSWKYNRISGTSILTNTVFSDNTPVYGNNYYMVRAVKLEKGSGTYYNLSQGIFDTVKIISVNVPEMFVPDFNVNIFPQPSHGEFTILLSAVKDEEFTIEIYDLLGKLVYSTKYFASNGMNNISIANNKISSGTYICKIRNTRENQLSKRLVIIE